MKKYLKKFLNLFRRKKKKVYLHSFGGVGTMLFYFFIKEYLPVNGAGEVHHGMEKSIKPGERVIYIYGNPIHAIMSFYRKHQVDGKFLYEHAGNLKIKEKIPPTIDEYATSKRDIFKLEEHFDKFYNGIFSYPILFIKYDGIWDNLKKILSYIKLKRYLNKFPEKRQRNSHENQLNPATLEILKEIYDPLIKKMEKLPDFYLKK